jgi:hypothetical protein
VKAAVKVAVKAAAKAALADAALLAPSVGPGIPEIAACALVHVYGTNALRVLHIPRMLPETAPVSPDLGH